MRLCKKGSATLDVTTRQDKLWFPFLSSLLKSPINHRPGMFHFCPHYLEDKYVTNELYLNYSTSVSPVEIKPLIQQILNSMSGYVNMPAVIQIILQDPAYSGGTFGEIRDLMMG